jgi:hypothetical protein
MSFSGKVLLSFRLKLLLAILAAAAAGIYLCYGGVKSALRPYEEDEAGAKLLARLDLAAAALESETASGLERAGMTAARTGLREILSRQTEGQSAPTDAAAIQDRLHDAAQASPSMVSIDLLAPSGRTAASLEKSGIGTDHSKAEYFRRGLRGGYISAPQAVNGNLYYEIAVPAPLPKGKPGRGPAGVLRCRFKALPRLQQTLGSLSSAGLTLAIGKLSGEKLILTAPGVAAKEFSAKAPEAAAFVPFMSGGERFSSNAKRGPGGMLYAARAVAGTDWVAAAGMPLGSAAGAASGLLERVRLTALLAFMLLAVSAVFAVNLLAGPLTEAGRQAGELLEICGMPPAGEQGLREPAAMAAAMETAAALIKKHTSKDVELETETEKLREEEADLKSQNDELEKLNKYLMEREIKISELKKEISELREKVGGGVQE